MNRAGLKVNPGKLGIAIGVYVVLSWVGYFVISNVLVSLDPIERLLSRALQSKAPAISLFLISAGIVAVLWLLSIIGLEKLFIKTDPDQASPFKDMMGQIRSFPFWLPLTLLVLEFGAAQLLANPCQSPVVTFTLLNGSETGVIQPNRPLHAAPDGTLTIRIAPVEKSVMLICQWRSAGSGVVKVGPEAACTTQVFLASEPSSAMLSVEVGEVSCPARDTYTLPILVGQP